MPRSSPFARCEYRRRTGRGQLVEVPMIDVVLNASALQVIDPRRLGRALTRRGNRGHEFAVQNVYACAGDEQWIAISVRGEDDWAALTDVLGNPQWSNDARCATDAARWAAAEWIDNRLADMSRHQATPSDRRRADRGRGARGAGGSAPRRHRQPSPAEPRLLRDASSTRCAGRCPTLGRRSRRRAAAGSSGGRRLCSANTMPKYSAGHWVDGSSARRPGGRLA